MTAGALAGLAIMIGSEAATIFRLEPFYSWNTPICWTGFILFADSVVFRARGRSWIRSAPREFALLALASIPLWLVFEFYNLYLNNWNYTGLPENDWLRMFGYGWAFATITPAIFEGAELIGLMWAPASTIRDPASAGSQISGGRRSWSMAAGALMLIVPFAAPPGLARYLAAPVFLGFIFLLEPINRRLGAESLDRRRFANLLLSGLLCGVLWEFWNFWAGAKWHYTVPIMEHLKIFEMPLPGYLGFPPFAVECFVMYVFVRALVAGPRAGRPIAL
ncbi:MAG TPA: hypothetical protein VH417_18560 [Vicinamibacterales bacterium]|jgi:hypothetical protein